MRFKVLGALEISHEHRVITLTAPKPRSVLALLLLRQKQVVSMGSLLEELWGDTPPRSAVTTAQTYIYQLRKLFLDVAPDRELLATRPPGYLLRIGEATLDADVFERLITQGRAFLDDGEPCQAAARLRQALALWDGPALANVAVGRLLEAHVAHLEEERIRALELRIEADMQLGRHRELVAELRSLVTVYPLNEWFHGRLMMALNSSGRRGEALQAFHNLRVVLNEELGLEPSPELQRLQHDVLTGSPAPISAGEPSLAHHAS